MQDEVEQKKSKDNFFINSESYKFNGSKSKKKIFVHLTILYNKKNYRTKIKEYLDHESDQLGYNAKNL